MADATSDATLRALEPLRARELTALGWILLNLKVGAFSFGTGSVAPIYRRALVVEARLLTAEQFQDVLTVAQLLPGANLVSLTMALGTRLFGYGAGAAGVAALCLPGAMWALLTLCAMPMGVPLVRALVAGFAMGAAVLLLDLALQLAHGLRATHVRDLHASTGRRRFRLLVALAVAALALFGVPLLSIIALGVVGGAVAELLA